MTHIIQSIHNTEHKVSDMAERFACMHPYLVFMCMFVGMPVFMLAAVFSFTFAIVYPIAWICGWL